MMTILAEMIKCGLLTVLERGNSPRKKRPNLYNKEKKNGKQKLHKKQHRQYIDKRNGSIYTRKLRQR